MQKSKMAAAAILKKLNGHNFASFERICTKFDTDTKNKVPGLPLPSEFVSHKIQDGGGRHIGNHIFGHPFLHAFAPNLKHRLEMGSHSQIYRQNSYSAKIQDGGGRHFEKS